MTHLQRNVQPRPRQRRRAKARGRGMTLIEILLAMTILAFISMLVFQAMDGLRRSREGVERVADRFREGRMAMARMTRELQSAYLSAHAPIDESLRVARTTFTGKPGSPAAQVDFTAMSHRRLARDSKESDQEEISYFGSEDPDQASVTDLARRQASIVDEEPDKGGRVDVMATNIDLFDLEYFDPVMARWVDEWDSESVVEEKGRLPRAVKIVLVLKDGVRSRESSGRGTVRLVSKVQIPTQDVLSFALK